MIVPTIEEFEKATGIDLIDESGLKSENIDSKERNAKLSLVRWATILYQEVNAISITLIPEDEKLSEAQVKALKQGVYNLGIYYIMYGDQKANNGVGENGSKLEIVPSSIIRDLKNVGLVRKAFGRGFVRC